jgi:hypothetical protein
MVSVSRFSALAALLLAAFPASAAAEWHLGAEALTDYPVQVGGKIWLELPDRVRLSSSLGYMPDAYMRSVNTVLVDTNVYSQQTADLLLVATRSSLVWRTHAGWRPFSRHGLYGEVGYALVTLGGGATTAELITIATGAQLPPDNGPNQNGYTVSSTLHMVDVEIGWQWFVWKGLSLRAALGFAGTFAASTVVKPTFQPRMPGPNEAFARAASDYLNQLYTSYVDTPVATIAAGWRFF